MWIHRLIQSAKQLRKKLALQISVLRALWTGFTAEKGTPSLGLQPNEWIVAEVHRANVERLRVRSAKLAKAEKKAREEARLKNPQTPDDLCRAIALGKIVVPENTDPQWQAAMDERLMKRNTIQSGNGIWHSWGNGEFQREEKARLIKAIRMLRRGFAEGAVCHQCLLEPEEVQRITQRMDRSPR